MDVLAGRGDLIDVSDALVAEYDGLLPAGAVLRCVARCRDELLALRLGDGLSVTLEAMARRRLRARVAPG